LPAVPETQGEFETTAMLRYENIPAEMAEGLRGVINRYELRSGERIPKSIAVTSPLPGEGVTTVSQALATIIAQEMGSFVCWVDCGWLAADGSADRPSARPNLVEILADQSRIISAFQASPELPQLMSLAPGPVPESKRNMIVRSPEFERLLAILAEEFDHVVFDVPPVLTNANGLALLRRADASLLVVRHRSTTLAQVRRAVEATQPTPNIGTLLNRYRTSIPVRVRRLLGA
jgi:Mrp family chromosome partitioning ATPase